MAKGMAKKEWQQDTAGIPRSSSPLPFVLPLVIFLMIASRYPDFASEEEPDTILRSAQWYLGMIALQVYTTLYMQTANPHFIILN